jgi:hypothetical protein
MDEIPTSVSNARNIIATKMIAPFSLSIKSSLFTIDVILSNLSITEGSQFEL